MKLNIQEYNGIKVLELQGELDCEVVGQFKGKIEDLVNSNNNSLVLDMSKVTFIDSEGLEYLLWARDYCNENRIQLRLAAVNDNCDKILEITRLDNEFDRHPDLSEALKSFV
jgi:anti-anti-sigma factor